MSDILVVGERRGGEIQDISFELVTAAQKLADGTGGEVHAAVVGGDESSGERLRREGVDTVHVVEYDGEFNHDAYVEIVRQLDEAIEPGSIVLPHSVSGMDYAPAVAGRLDRPLVTNATDVDYDGSFRITRKMFGSKVDCTVGVEGDGVVLTVRVGQFDAAEEGGTAEITRFSPELDAGSFDTEVVEVSEIDSDEDVDITQSEFIVSVGLGVDDEEDLELIEEFADEAGATLASSKPIVERGWLPRSRQVGQSGETVTPRIYVAIGISGAIEHLVGMKGSDTIVAINNDPDAPIFDVADYGIVDDLGAVVPELVDQLADR